MPRRKQRFRPHSSLPARNFPPHSAAWPSSICKKLITKPSRRAGSNKRKRPRPPPPQEKVLPTLSNRHLAKPNGSSTLIPKSSSATSISSPAPPGKIPRASTSTNGSNNFWSAAVLPPLFRGKPNPPSSQWRNPRRLSGTAISGCPHRPALGGAPVHRAISATRPAHPRHRQPRQRRRHRHRPHRPLHRRPPPRRLPTLRQRRRATHHRLPPHRRARAASPPHRIRPRRLLPRPGPLSSRRHAPHQHLSSRSRGRRSLLQRSPANSRLHARQSCRALCPSKSQFQPGLRRPQPLRQRCRHARLGGAAARKENHRPALHRRRYLTPGKLANHQAKIANLRRAHPRRLSLRRFPQTCQREE